jgi:hypothetical protein
MADYFHIRSLWLVSSRPYLTRGQTWVSRHQALQQWAVRRDTGRPSHTPCPEQQATAASGRAFAANTGIHTNDGHRCCAPVARHKQADWQRQAPAMYLLQHLPHYPGTHAVAKQCIRTLPVSSNTSTTALLHAAHHPVWQISCKGSYLKTLADTPC